MSGFANTVHTAKSIFCHDPHRDTYIHVTTKSFPKQHLPLLCDELHCFLLQYLRFQLFLRLPNGMHTKFGTKQKILAWHLYKDTIQIFSMFLYIYQMMGFFLVVVFFFFFRDNIFRCSVLCFTLPIGYIYGMSKKQGLGLDVALVPSSSNLSCTRSGTILLSNLSFALNGRIIWKRKLDIKPGPWL